METLVLDGKKFHGVNDLMSAVQDDFIMTQLRRSGAMDMLLGVDTLPLEERQSRSVEMFDRIVESGRKFKLLAGLLIEEGKIWTQAEAETNAARFAAITDTDEKLRMNRAARSCVAFFFRPAGGSLPISQNSSNQNGEDRATASAEAATSAISP